MHDLISRRAAIKAIEDLPNCYNGFSDTYDKACIIGVIEEVPPTDPVKHGKWLEHRNGQWVYAKCSKCKTIHDVRSNYCPNCGAKMDGEEDDNHDYERAIDELEHNILYEPTFNIDDGSM